MANAIVFTYIGIWALAIGHVVLSLRRRRFRAAMQQQRLKLQKQELELKNQSQSMDFNSRLVYLNEYIHELERDWICEYFNQDVIKNVSKLTERLELMSQETEKGSELSHMINESASLLLKQAKMIKTVVGHLKPDHISELGLIPALKGFFHRNNYSNTISITVEGSQPMNRFHPDLEVTLHRITTGLVIHTMQRKRATRISIFVEQHEKQVKLHYTDNDPEFTALDIAHVPSEEKDPAILRIEILLQMIYAEIQYDIQYIKGLKLVVAVDTSKY
ncbi:MAG TPA: hypothetical protein DCE41_09275 [Cytophagales bacterium]|nr:hypothetical protein [Cytophagales bacterium]